MRDQARDHTFVVEDEIDLLLSRANPNPARVGCLARDVLPELARRQRSIDDPAWVHVSKCSECFVEIRALQQSAKMRKRRGGLIGQWTMIAATIIVTSSVGLWLVGRSGENGIEQQGAPPPLAAVAPTSIEIDLRDRATERGDQKPATTQPLLLPRGPAGMTILLPVGAEPGAYELELIDAEGEVRTSAIGTASVQDFITTLYAELDSALLTPGPYKLGIRGLGGVSRFVPVSLE